jgi:general secretion pathway protein B
MSFILDALRKSENERQRNTTPGIATAPVRGPAKRQSIWVPLVAVLIGVNLSLLAVLWYTGDRATPPAAEASPGPVMVPAAAPAPAAIPVADPETSRELSVEFEPLAEPAPATAAAAAPQPADTGPVPLPAAPTTGAAAPVVDVPTLNELLLDGSLSLPPLHLDIHVYSETPAERFVFINTAKYREGERISEGPTVDEINQLGVVLRHQNRRFLLTRE